MSGLSLVYRRCLGSILVASLLCFFGGCDEGADTASPPDGGNAVVPEQETGPKTVSAEGLPELSHPMPAQDGGRIIISGPHDWDRASRSTRYLARFYRRRGSQPSITVFFDDSDDLPIRTVTLANLEEFGELMRVRVAESSTGSLAERVRPMVIGDQPCVRYVSRGILPDGGAEIERVTLVTLVDGRLYRMELWILPGEESIRLYQPKVYAMMAGLRFVTVASTEEEVEEPEDLDTGEGDDASGSPEDEEEEESLPPSEDDDDNG